MRGPALDGGQGNGDGLAPLYLTIVIKTFYFYFTLLILLK